MWPTGLFESELHLTPYWACAKLSMRFKLIHVSKGTQGDNIWNTFAGVEWLLHIFPFRDIALLIQHH